MNDQEQTAISYIQIEILDDDPLMIRYAECKKALVKRTQESGGAISVESSPEKFIADVEAVKEFVRTTDLDVDRLSVGELALLAVRNGIISEQTDYVQIIAKIVKGRLKRERESDEGTDKTGRKRLVGSGFVLELIAHHKQVPNMYELIHDYADPADQEHEIAKAWWKYRLVDQWKAEAAADKVNEEFHLGLGVGSYYNTFMPRLQNLDNCLGHPADRATRDLFFPESEWRDSSIYMYERGLWKLARLIYCFTDHSAEYISC